MIVDGFLQWNDTQHSNHTPKQTLLLREVSQQKLDLIGLQKERKRWSSVDKKVEEEFGASYEYNQNALHEILKE